jgi:hypothetical protein
MDIEVERKSSSRSSQDGKSENSDRLRPGRRQKIVICMIAVVAFTLGTLAYLNKSAAPTTWESMRTDYKNTK